LLRKHINPLARKLQLVDKLPEQADRRYFSMFENDEALFIAFPGTDANNSNGTRYQDVVADLRAFHSEQFDGVGVHAGFYKRFEDSGFLDDVARLVTSEAYAHKRIVFTGHSLGAAVAAVFALHVLVSIPGEIRKRVHCVGFAQPLVGDHRLADYVGTHGLQDRFTVIVNDFDIVPRLCLMQSEHAQQVLNAISQSTTGSQLLGQAVSMITAVGFQRLKASFPILGNVAGLASFVADNVKPQYAPFGTYVFLRRGVPTRLEHSERDARRLLRPFQNDRIL
jgi:pimeloyl-ACP methyl ester carboxylesterase